MRRLIYASARDDLIRQRDEYDAETARYQEVQDNNTKAFRAAYKKAQQDIENLARNAIGSTSQDLEIRVDESFANSWEISIYCHERDLHSENTSLAWHIDLKLDKDGNVAKETGSWSGLRATTPEQIDDLKESVRLIETINNIDWEPILKRALVDYAAFQDSENSAKLRERTKSRPDFEKQIAESEISDIVGTNKWVKVQGSPTTYINDSGRGIYWVNIVSETPARYKALIVRDYAMQNGLESSEPLKLFSDYYTVNKSALFSKLVKPLEIVEKGVTLL